MDKVKLYGGKVVICFEQGRHRYTHADGSPIMSVTKPIGTLDKPGLMWWAAGLAAEHIFDNWDTNKSYYETEKLALCRDAYFKHRERKTEKAERGTAVHDYAEQFVLGSKPAMPKDPNVRNGANAFMKWWNETKLEPVKTERIVYSKEIDIAGRADLIAKQKTSKGKNGYHLVDYKSVSMYKKAKFYERDKYPDGFVIDERSGEKVKYPVFDGPILQAAAYRAFLQEETGKAYGESYIVRFDQEFGDFDVTIVSKELQDVAYEAYKHLVEVTRYLAKYGAK